MVTAELRILGPPSFTINGRAVRLHSIKAIALLAYLVCEAETPHSRAKLSALFWPTLRNQAPTKPTAGVVFAAPCLG